MKYTPVKPIEQLDLTQLKPLERASLERDYYKANVGWPMALMMVALLVASFIGLTGSAGEVPGVVWLFIGVKIVGYLGLGFWARNWSRIATLLLLSWHVYFYHMFAGEEDLRFKLTFWIPAAVFLWALIGAVARNGLIKKAEQNDAS